MRLPGGPLIPPSVALGPVAAAVYEFCFPAIDLTGSWLLETKGATVRVCSPGFEFGSIPPIPAHTGARI